MSRVALGRYRPYRLFRLEAADDVDPVRLFSLAAGAVPLRGGVSQDAPTSKLPVVALLVSLEFEAGQGSSASSTTVDRSSSIGL